MPAIAPCLWFDGKAEEAANFYISTFRQGKIIDLMYCTDSGPGPKGSVLSVTFEISGQRFIALNGGPQYVFSPAMSLFVSCESQAEVDELWENLSAGGEKQVCGWLKDRYGVSWQIVPAALGAMLRDPDAVRASRAMQAIMGMTKLDLAALQQAYQGSGQEKTP